MKRHRLLLELKKGDHVLFTVRDHDEPLGAIKLDERCPLNYVNLVFEFIPLIEIIRDSAKCKGPKMST
jgi:hypothetical protein